MQRTKPPFRADHVGSLLRTAPLKDARAQHEAGKVTDAQLKEIENTEIEKVVRKQEQIGLKLATDGEFRRSWWHFDFMKALTGAEMYNPNSGIQFHGVQTKQEGIRVTSKLDFPANHPMIEHFKFLKSVCKVTPKMTIPAPPVMHFRLSRAAIDTTIYGNWDTYFDDLGKTWRKAVKAFYDAGCRYLQFDDTAWAYLCSETELKQARERGLDTTDIQKKYAACTNYAIAEKPADMTITTHVCRGNFRSTWISSGGYEPVAETLLSKVNYDGYFLEYDSDRAGGFEPLRFLPKGNKQVVLGLITSKSGTLENKDDVKRRIDEASKFANLEQFSISPQCGFASTEEGNALAEDEQWRKLSLCVELANEVWK